MPAALAPIGCVAAFLGVFAAILYFAVAQVAASLPGLSDAATSLATRLGAWLSESPLADDSPVVRNAVTELQSSLGAVLQNVGTGW